MSKTGSHPWSARRFERTTGRCGSASAAAAALLQEDEGNRTYELGGPAFDLAELARVISEVAGTKVTYRDLPAEEYANAVQRAGLDEATAHFDGRPRCPRSRAATSRPAARNYRTCSGGLSIRSLMWCVRDQLMARQR